MDGTTNQNTASATPPAPTPPAPTPQPTPTTPPIQTAPKSPFPLKWALIGIALIVVLAGGILGLLASNNTQTTETSAAGSATAPVGSRQPTRVPPNWPFATLPNAMIEKGTIDFEVERDNNGKETGFITLHGGVIFATTSFSGSEAWVVWASSDDRGKQKVGTTYPKGNAQLGEPVEPFRNPGTFSTGPSYPADSDRDPDAPKPEENEGKLINSTRKDPKTGEEIDIQPHIFHIHQIPKATCELYLNYRSNRQGGNSVGNNSPMFYKVTLPACKPTPTQFLSSPTPSRRPSPTPFIPNLPPGCTVLMPNSFNDTTKGYPNHTNCRELCGLTTTNRSCAAGERGCVIQACRAATNNPNKLNHGAWYCCKRANCNRTCRTSAECSPGLACNAGRCGDKVACSADNSCQCGPDEVVATPTQIPEQGRR